MTETPVVQRIVPGAPSHVEVSKSQKKKKKAVKADDPQSPMEVETSQAQEHSEGVHVPGLVSRAESQALQLSEEDKQTPMVDLMNRRLKAVAKKIARISTYASTDIEKLNDDQVRSLKNLPTLEAIHKELGEVKKVIETHESEIAQELAVKRLEAEKAEKARISNAVSNAEAILFTRFNDVLNVLRVHSLLTSGALDISSLADSSEISAIVSVSDLLIEEHGQRQSIVEQIIRGVGEFEGIPYTRLLAITHQALNPPAAPSPVPEESVDEEPPAPASVNGVEDEEDEEEEPVTGIPNVANSMSGSFQFIQQSELEAPAFETASEWVDAAKPEPEPEAAADNTEPIPPISEAPQRPLDWADEESGLPSIAGLQAEFANSGSATPAEAEQAAPPEGAENSWQLNGEATTNGDAGPVEVDEDGFTQAKGRGRGRGGFRGERGFRGGRGGEKGGHGGPRGGDRGFRSGRGDRGGFRGRGGGEWRGDGERTRGDGERGADGERGSWGDGERGDGDRHREGGRGRGGGHGRGRDGEGGRGRSEGGRGRGGEGRGRGGEGRPGRGRGGRGDRGGHHHEASPAPA